MPENLCDEDSIEIKAIIVTDDLSSVDDSLYPDLEGVYVTQGLKLPGSVHLLSKKLSSLLNATVNQETIQLIENKILAYYSNYKHYMVMVEIPEQEISSGVVVFVVKQAQIGNITYCGGRWYTKERVEKRLELSSGSMLDENTLLNEIAWLNHNPFHYTNILLAPGKKLGTTDVEVITKDRFPVRFYTGGSNNGVESTGRSRYYGGLTFGNAFFADDLLTYQFTSNKTYNKFHSHSLDYTSFLPWKHIFNLCGGYAKIDPDIRDFQKTGKDAQAALRYKIPFGPLYTNFQHQLYVGIDYKYITSSLFFVGEISPKESVMDSQANVTQGVFGYALESSSNTYQIAFGFEVLGSPAKWLPHQSQSDYNSLRQNAKPRYLYGTCHLSGIYTFPKGSSLAMQLRLQGSLNTLIPSEQFQLGGYNTVRGYEESVFISDNGLCANLEWRTRPFSFLKSSKDALTFLSFVDYGWGYNYHSFDGIATAAQLWGIGPGARYNINPYLDIRVDYGFKLHHVGFDDNKLGMWHVGATFSY